MSVGLSLKDDSDSHVKLMLGSAQILYKDINKVGCTVRETSLRSYLAKTREEHA